MLRKQPGSKHQPNSEFNLRPKQVRQLIDAARDVRNRSVVMFFAYTGIRRAELRLLRTTDIDLDACQVWIRHGKGGKQRLVFIPTSMSATLEVYLSQIESGFLFPGRGGSPLSLRAINNIVATVGRDAQIRNPNPRYRNLNPHLLRHSLARNWKDTGASMESLQRLLGHASIRTTLELYGTESVSEVQRNYCAIADRLVTPER